MQNFFLGPFYLLSSHRLMLMQHRKQRRSCDQGRIRGGLPAPAARRSPPLQRWRSLQRMIAACARIYVIGIWLDFLCLVLPEVAGLFHINWLTSCLLDN